MLITRIISRKGGSISSEIEILAGPARHRQHLGVAKAEASHLRLKYVKLVGCSTGLIRGRKGGSISSEIEIHRNPSWQTLTESVAKAEASHLRLK